MTHWSSWRVTSGCGMNKVRRDVRKHHRKSRGANHTLRRFGRIKLSSFNVTTVNRGDKNNPVELVRIREMCEQYESIAHTAPNCFTIIDSNFIYQAVNESYCLAHGKTQDEILGRKVADVWGDQVFRAIIQEPLERCLAGHEVHYQARFEFPKTGLRYFDVSYFPYRQNGLVTHSIVVTRDVTENRRTEEEVRLLLSLTRAVNEAQSLDSALEVALRRICEATGWVLGQAWIPSADGDCLRCSPSWHHVIRGLENLRTVSSETYWKPGEGLVGRVWSSKQPAWVTEANEDSSLPAVYRNSESGIKAAMAIPVIANDQVVAVIEFCVLEPRTEDERLMGVVSVVAAHLGTIFLRKRSADALRESEERYRKLIDTAKDVIFRLTLDGKVASLNSAFEAVTGWTCDEWLGQDFAPLLHPDDRPVALDRFQSIVRGDAATHNAYRVRKKSGEYAVGEFTLSPEVVNGAPVGVFGIARDVTERNRAEEAVRQSEEHYRELFHQAYRMQEVLRDLSNRVLEVQEEERTRISRELHDEVGQALTAISVNLAVLKKEIAAGNERFTKKIEDSQNLLSETMETVHGFARELRPAMLDDLGLLAALRSYTKAFEDRTNIRIHFRASAAGIVETLSPTHKIVIYRVAQESLNNVAKHARASRVDFTIAKQHQRILVKIVDNGKGFSLEQYPGGKATNRLGLLGMQERVRLINGDFSVESQPGKGTAVQVEIPLQTVSAR